MRRRLIKDKKGQFMILTSVGMLSIMIAFAILLSYLAISPMQYSTNEFRDTVTDLSLNFKRGLATAIADITKELDYKASVDLYENYTKLEDWPQAEKRGHTFLSQWVNKTILNYSGLGVNVSISSPEFYCDWSTSEGYSKAVANMSVDILSYGFYGFEMENLVEVNITMTGLDAGDGNVTGLFVNVMKENNIPISELTSSLTKIFYRKGSNFEGTNITEVEYFGEGNYLIKMCSGLTPILEALNSLKTKILELGSESFIPPHSPEELCDRVDVVINLYNLGVTDKAHDVLFYYVRPHLEKGTWRTWVKEGVDTGIHLVMIDNIRSQLSPRLKVLLNDPRGITVGAYAWLGMDTEDIEGPTTEKIIIIPNPTRSGQIATLTATITDARSNIQNAEYFIDTIGANGTGTPLTPIDGTFNSQNEEVITQINTEGWIEGNYTIYIHGKDEVNNWGPINTITLEVEEDNTGPTTENLIVTPNPINPNENATLTATITDTTSNIQNAEYFIDTIGANGTGTPLTPIDGTFNSQNEEVITQINTEGWIEGNYTIYIHGKDEVNNWGPINTITLEVETSIMSNITLRPTGSGSVEELDEDYPGVSNWECVDETPSDYWTTVVRDDNQYNGYDTDIYMTEDHSSETGTIDSVIVYVNCIKNGLDSDISYARTALRIGDTNYFGSGNVLISSWTTYSTSYVTNPAGGAWTWADIDSLQSGVSLDSGDTTGGSQSVAVCTQVWVEVNYTS